MIVSRIHLSWRRARGESRFLVGEVMRQGENEFTFKYNLEEVSKAKEEGFSNYPEFPVTYNDVIYRGDLRSVFSLRLMPEGRADRNEYLGFWEANNPNYDWFDELALTEGKLATDNFEFLGDYDYNLNGFRFVTDLTSLSRLNLPPNILSVHDKLDFKKEDTDSLSLIKVFKNNTYVGNIKKGHDRYFKDANPNRLHLTVKTFEKNGKVNAIYVLVVKK